MLQVAVFAIRTSMMLPRLYSCPRIQIWIRKNKKSIAQAVLEESFENFGWQTLGFLDKQSVAKNQLYESIVAKDLEFFIVFGLLGFLWLFFTKSVQMWLSRKSG